MDGDIDMMNTGGAGGESGSIIFTGIYDARCKKIQSIAQPPTMRHQAFTSQAFRKRHLKRSLCTLYSFSKCSILY